MNLTAENYFSKESSKKYLSVSQYKNFIGSLGRPGCEARGLAELNGEFEQEKTTSLLVGSYVDAHYEGSLDLFKAQNPEIFTQKGTLKAEYKRAEEIINRLERDEEFSKYMSGQKQVIMTADMFGTPWKIKIDSYHPGVCIVDLKVMESLGKSFYLADTGRMNFVDNWGYYIQGAVYQKVVEINTGKKLPFYLAAASKEKVTDLDIIQFEQSKMDEALAEVESNIPKILALKNGEIEPIRCGRRDCDYCKATKVITGPIWSSELLGEC